MNTRLRLDAILIMAVALLWQAPACADEISDARAAAVSALERLEQRKNSDVWQSDMSDWFKDRMTRAAFLANMTVIQAQLGGPASGREIIQQNKAPGMAGYTGEVYSFTFETSFPAANVYEMIALIREGGKYRVSGLNFVPNPNK